VNIECRHKIGLLLNIVSFRRCGTLLESLRQTLSHGCYLSHRLLSGYPQCTASLQRKQVN